MFKQSICLRSSSLSVLLLAVLVFVSLYPPRAEAVSVTPYNTINNAVQGSNTNPNAMMFDQTNYVLLICSGNSDSCITYTWSSPNWSARPNPGQQQTTSTGCRGAKVLTGNIGSSSNMYYGMACN